jgi:hypothetical protein
LAKALELVLNEKLKDFEGRELGRPFVLFTKFFDAKNRKRRIKISTSTLHPKFLLQRITELSQKTQLK